ncbi:MAG: 50S ribosomal protein L18 [Chloroflexota bacterium]
MNKGNRKRLARIRRHRRVRKKLSGSPEIPRLNVFRSLNEIYSQLIDDVEGTTLVSASTIDKQLRDQVEGKPKADQARIVGLTIAERALEKGIKKVVFDRGGWQYQGRIKALADGAREGGLEF